LESNTGAIGDLAVMAISNMDQEATAKKIQSQIREQVLNQVRYQVRNLPFRQAEDQIWRQVHVWGQGQVSSQTWRQIQQELDTW
jgi:hypothetical protein